jgi:hypothetical protein
MWFIPGRALTFGIARAFHPFRQDGDALMDPFDVDAPVSRFASAEKPVLQAFEGAGP